MVIVVAGLLMALVIGITLGLIGGGGSILTVPVFVYVMGIPPVEATAYSLFVVGATSAAGAYGYQKDGLIAWKDGLIFAIPSLIAVFIIRSAVVPAIPDTLGGAIGLSFSKDLFIMVLFAIIMAMASITMIKDGVQIAPNPDMSATKKAIIIMLEGFGVGAVTGLVGAGGGFLIIPALVILMGMDMKMAVGTSLMIIAVKSLIGFTGDVISLPHIDWTLILQFTALSLVGVWIGLKLSKRIPGQKLKKAFGYFVAIMAVAILLAELL
jgi:uncharacterized membrane protein YfcA